VLNACPTSLITAESIGLVEEFFVRKRLGEFNLFRLTARQVEAFAVLESAWIAEMNNVQQDTR
jgi:hypothetical protein